jgi:hypothetical protein
VLSATPASREISLMPILRSVRLSRVKICYSA